MPLIGNLLIQSGTPPWVSLVSGDWLGDTGSFTLGTETATANAGDKNVRTSSSFIGASKDFDFEVICGTYPSGAGTGLLFGYSQGSGTGTETPTTTDPQPYAKNAGSTIGGWRHNNDTNELAKSNGWMSTLTLRVSRRGSTFYGLIGSTLDVTYVSFTNSGAGCLFIGAPGAGSTYSMSGIRYRQGAPGTLPTI